MKCGTCGVEAFVVTTASNAGYMAVRTYRCFHGHTTETFEVLAASVNKRDVNTANRAARDRAATYARNQSILKDLCSMSSEAIGRKWGLSGARIRQIRDTETLNRNKDDNARLPVDHATATPDTATRYYMGRNDPDSKEP